MSEMTRVTEPVQEHLMTFQNIGCTVSPAL